MRVLLKNPESTTSRPVASVVQAPRRSGETMPSSDRNSKIFQRSRPRIDMEDPSRDNWIALASDGLDQCRFSTTIRSQDAHVLASLDAQGNIVERRAYYFASQLRD